VLGLGIGTGLGVGLEAGLIIEFVSVWDGLHFTMHTNSPNGGASVVSGGNRNFRSQELSLPGTKVPGMELSLLGTKMPWNFRSRERK